MDSFQKTFDSSTDDLDQSVAFVEETEEDERRLNSDSEKQKHQRRADALPCINDAGLRFQSTRGLHEIKDATFADPKVGGRYCAPERHFTG